MSSQQLVRKLLRATEDENAALGAPAAGARQQNNKKRKRRGEEDEAAVEMSEDQIVDWHVQTLILGLDRKMAARGLRNSSARAIDKSLRRLEQRQEAKPAIQPPGSGCGRTSAAQKRPEPTFNKKRYEAEKKQKKLQKLRRALKALDKEDKEKKKKSK